MADPNAGIEEIIADTYDALGLPDRAAMVRQDLDPHDSLDELIDAALRTRVVLDAVPDSKAKKHNDTCWQLHAACLRDKLWADMGWE